MAANVLTTSSLSPKQRLGERVGVRGKSFRRHADPVIANTIPSDPQRDDTPHFGRRFAGNPAFGHNVSISHSLSSNAR